MSGKIALITGGSRGLGRSAALHLAKSGVDVVLTYNSRADAAQAVVGDIEAMGRKAVALQLDASDTAAFAGFARDVAAALEGQWGRNSFDFLINNAGYGAHNSVMETTEAELNAMYAVHFKGPFLLTQQLLPLMADGGRILNISSGLTRFSMPGFAAYASMKGAVEVMTQYMAKELGDRGIAVNTLAPGAIETDFGGGVVRDNADVNSYVASTTAMGRVGLPDDIGGAVAALLAGDTQWITAQRIEVSGGMLI